MKTKNVKTTKLVFSAALVSCAAALAAPAPAHADPATDMVINMGIDVAKSLAKDYVKDQLFPAQGINYRQIRDDMEQVIRKELRDASISDQIDDVGGLIDGASTRVRSAINHGDPVASLEVIRLELVRDISRLTNGKFKLPGLGTYVLGAQVDMTILAMQLERRPELKAGVGAGPMDCDRECVIKNIRDSVEHYSKYLHDTGEAVVADARAAVEARVSACWNDWHMVEDYSRSKTGGGKVKEILGWRFKDDTRNFQSRHFKDNETGCQEERSKYVLKYSDEAELAARKGMKWMYLDRALWTKQLLLATKKADLENKTREGLVGLIHKVYFERYAECGIGLLNSAGATQDCRIDHSTRPSDLRPGKHNRRYDDPTDPNAGRTTCTPSKLTACQRYEQSVHFLVQNRGCTDHGGVAQYMKLADYLGCKI